MTERAFNELDGVSGSGEETGRSKYTEITRCRMTGSDRLVPVLDLGQQVLTGVFPMVRDVTLTRGPLELVLCLDGGLLQLRHSYDPRELYGPTYGYRSGLNQAMVSHLRRKASALEQLVDVRAGDVVLDIGGNDATYLKSYTQAGQNLGSIDPSAEKFAEFYPPHVRFVSDFFSESAYTQLFGDKPAKIITSMAMFYDLEDPLGFMQAIAGMLAPDGVWHFEQSYMPTMMARNAYDTICHEHLEYYALGPVAWMAERAGLKILDVELNDINGGSFAVTAARAESSYAPRTEVLERLMRDERALRLDEPETYLPFKERVFGHRDELTTLVRSLREGGARVFGYGASTKGNVLLQFCGFGPDDLECIADVNPEKHGCYTPGTGIPIVSEADARQREPDFYLVLPWHFRDNLVAREREFLSRGGKMIFPLPQIEIVGA